jgi:hypothetical protein
MSQRRRRMALKMVNNQALTDRFSALLPDGHTYSKIALEATKTRIFCQIAEGSPVWCEDVSVHRSSVDLPSDFGMNLFLTSTQFQGSSGPRMAIFKGNREKIE